MSETIEWECPVYVADNYLYSCESEKIDNLTTAVSDAINTVVKESRNKAIRECANICIHLQTPPEYESYDIKTVCAEAIEGLLDE